MIALLTVRCALVTKETRRDINNVSEESGATNKTDSMELFFVLGVEFRSVMGREVITVVFTGT